MYHCAKAVWFYFYSYNSCFKHFFLTGVNLLFRLFRFFFFFFFNLILVISVLGHLVHGHKMSI